MKLYLAVLCMLLLVSLRASAGDRTLFVTGGAIVYDLKKTSGDETGKKTLGPLYTEMGLRWRPSASSNKWMSDFTLNYTPFSHNLADNSASSSILLLGAALGRRIGAFDLHIGPAMLMYSVKGSGGLVTQNNGLSTATFTNPSSTVTDRTFCFAGGLALQSGGMFFGIDTFASEPLGSRRTFSLLGQLGVAIL